MARTPSIELGQSFAGSFFAEGAIKQYMGVKKGSDDHQVKPLADSDTSGTLIEGIAQFEADDGESVSVVLLGPSVARAKGSVTRGDLLECIYDAVADKNGNMKTITVLANGKMIAAIALEAAADGENFKVMLIRQMQLAVS